MASCGAARQPWPSNVNSHDGVPCFGRQIPDDPVADDAGVVDEDVEPTPFADRSVDHCFSVGFVGYVSVVRDGGSLTCSDELDREISVLAGAFAGHRTPQVVDHDTCTVTSQLQSMTATNAMARPRDNGHLSFKHFVHASLPSQRLGIGSNGADVNGACRRCHSRILYTKDPKTEAAPIGSADGCADSAGPASQRPAVLGHHGVDFVLTESMTSEVQREVAWFGQTFGVWPIRTEQDLLRTDGLF